jgi:hypothetical protein
MAKLQSKSYRLTDDRSGESFMLKTGKKGNITVFDEVEKIRRAIRHCPNQRSIYMDEQDKYALVQPIIFINGYLEVPANQPMTQKFLDAHPSNSANSSNGGWFEEVNEKLEAKESIQDDEKRMDVKYAVRAKAKEQDGLHELRAVVAVISGSVEDTYLMEADELKNYLYNEIEADVEYFLDENGNVSIFEDDEIQRKYLTLRAIREGIIKKNATGRSILWAKDNKVIATAPRSMEIVEYFADYLTTEDGILVLEEITRRS